MLRESYPHFGGLLHYEFNSVTNSLAKIASQLRSQRQRHSAFAVAVALPCSPSHQTGLRQRGLAGVSGKTIYELAFPKPPKARLFRESSGSLAIFAAIRRASSRRLICYDNSSINAVSINTLSD